MHFASVAILAATTALATPTEPREKIAVLPLRKVHHAKLAKNLAARGQAKLQHINGYNPVDSALTNSGPATNELVSYIASVTVGSSSYDLIIDTGSSNTWVGATKKYSPGSTAHDTGNSVSVNYGAGSISSRFSGEEYIDKVSFAGLTAQSQSIGAASSSSGFDGVDGILGVGPVSLTRGTVANTNTVPTLMDTLYSEGQISQEVLGISFRPESGGDTDDVNGELTLGGTDSSKFTGSISYFPSPGPYWSVSVSSFTYGTKSLGSGSGIVDTGTTLIYIPDGAFTQFSSATGGRIDKTGLISFSKKPTANFGVTINGKTYTLTPDQYLVPKVQYENLGLSSGRFYAWIGNGGKNSVNTIIGQKFLEYYYSIYDTKNARVGFAPNA